METVHDGLSVEIRSKEQVLAHDDAVDILEELLVCQHVKVCRLACRKRILYLQLQILLLVNHRLGNLVGKRLVFAADNPVLAEDDDGKGCYGKQSSSFRRVCRLVGVCDG